MDNLAREYITYARRFVSNNSYIKAFDLYINAFEKYPDLKEDHEMEFRLFLHKFNDILYATNKKEDIFNNFARTLKLFPNNMLILNDVGKYLYKYGFYIEAWNHFLKALNLDSDFVDAEKNLNSVKNLLVPRWHYRMLNDKVRNFAYRDALNKTLRPGIDTVLDLGTCVLSMYAYENKPVCITAVECSKLMAEISKNITQDNGVKDVIIVNKNSNILNYRNIAGKKSLVVTEMFDAGLFGEHILQTVIHAWEHLIGDDGRIIPGKAEFYVALAQCKRLNMRYQLSSHIKTILSIPDLNVHVQTCDQPYDCEDICFFRDINYLAEPQVLLNVDFNNIKDLQQKQNQTEPFKTEFKLTETGELNSVVGWFTLHLTDEIYITTDPRCPNRATAWQQAVFFDNIPRKVIKDQTINLDFSLYGGKLTMVPDSTAQIDRISPETLRFLNDAQFVNIIMSFMGVASVYLGQLADMSQINIVDLCPFPVFGLMMLLRGANSLICYAKSPCDNMFIKKLLIVNNIDACKVTVLVGDEWTDEVFEKDKYHAIFCNVLELCGDIDVRHKGIAKTLKESYLLRGGLFIPSDIKVVAQLVSSPWLDHNNRVYDFNIGKYEVAKYLNKYQVSQNFCIDVNNLEYKAMSDPIVFGSIDTELEFEEDNVSVCCTSTANAILCWYKLELLEEMNELLTNSPTAFIDGSVFILNRNTPLIRGEVAIMQRCIDPDGSFKIQLVV